MSTVNSDLPKTLVSISSSINKLYQLWLLYFSRPLAFTLLNIFLAGSFCFLPLLSFIRVSTIHLFCLSAPNLSFCLSHLQSVQQIRMTVHLTFRATEAWCLCSEPAALSSPQPSCSSVMFAGSCKGTICIIYCVYFFLSFFSEGSLILKGEISGWVGRSVAYRMNEWLNEWASACISELTCVNALGIQWGNICGNIQMGFSKLKYVSLCYENVLYINYDFGYNL